MHSILTLPVLVAAQCLLFAADTDELAIRAMMEKRSVAWTKQDIPGMIADFAEDADYINSYGERIEGKANIEKRYKELLNENAGGQVKTVQAIDKIRILKPGIAIVDGVWSASGLVDAAGNSLPARKGLSTIILIKDGHETWKIASLRASVLPITVAK